mmetsp:Transcript_18932/g.57194  ORF Transcript_18932/g.57194 Transcript_18932/m.57194 type:complete len:231 (-) Transcript_18932:594-1286(-)
MSAPEYIVQSPGRHHCPLPPPPTGAVTTGTAILVRPPCAVGSRNDVRQAGHDRFRHQIIHRPARRHPRQLPELLPEVPRRRRVLEGPFGAVGCALQLMGHCCSVLVQGLIDIRQRLREASSRFCQSGVPRMRHCISLLLRQVLVCQGRQPCAELVQPTHALLRVRLFGSSTGCRLHAEQNAQLPPQLAACTLLHCCRVQYQLHVHGLKPKTETFCERVRYASQQLSREQR